MYFIRPLVRQDTQLNYCQITLQVPRAQKRVWGKNASADLVSLNNVTCLQVAIDAGQMVKLLLSID